MSAKVYFAASDPQATLGLPAEATPETHIQQRSLGEGWRRRTQGSFGLLGEPKFVEALLHPGNLKLILGEDERAVDPDCREGCVSS